MSNFEKFYEYDFSVNTGAISKILTKLSFIKNV